MHDMGRLSADLKQLCVDIIIDEPPYSVGLVFDFGVRFKHNNTTEKTKPNIQCAPT
jgi:hypothetical protein